MSTPRTTAFFNQVWRYFAPSQGNAHKIMKEAEEFARQLETELTAALARAAELEKKCAAAILNTKEKAP